MTIYDLKVGDKGTITEFLAGKEFKRRLVSLGVTKESHFNIKNITVMKNVFEIELDSGTLIALRKGEAQKVEVKLCKTS